MGLRSHGRHCSSQMAGLILVEQTSENMERRRGSLSEEPELSFILSVSLSAFHSHSFYLRVEGDISSSRKSHRMLSAGGINTRHLSFIHSFSSFHPFISTYYSQYLCFGINDEDHDHVDARPTGAKSKVVTPQRRHTERSFHMMIIIFFGVSVCSLQLNRRIGVSPSGI